MLLAAPVPDRRGVSHAKGATPDCGQAQCRHREKTSPLTIDRLTKILKLKLAAIGSK